MGRFWLLIGSGLAALPAASPLPPRASNGDPPWAARLRAFVPSAHFAVKARTIPGMKFGVTARTLSLFVLAVSTCAAQNTTVDLTEKSDVPAADISTILRTECPSVLIMKVVPKSDFTLEAVRVEVSHGVGIAPDESFKFTLSDRDGTTSRSISATSLASAVKDLCHAIKTFVAVEVVDTTNLTQSTDTRGDTSGGAAGTIVSSTTGRRTHTDTASIYVIIDGEHALLDCHERRKGCATISPGKYFGERDGDGIWVNYQMPVTHKPVRDHYKIAGSW
jgi:hypothetical protein